METTGQPEQSGQITPDTKAIDTVQSPGEVSDAGQDAAKTTEEAQTGKSPDDASVMAEMKTVPKKKSHKLRNFMIVLLVLLLVAGGAAAGAWFYLNQKGDTLLTDWTVKNPQSQPVAKTIEHEDAVGSTVFSGTKDIVIYWDEDLVVTAVDPQTNETVWSKRIPCTRSKCKIFRLNNEAFYFDDYDWDEEKNQAKNDLITIYDAFDGRPLAKKEFSASIFVYADKPGHLYVASSHSFMAFGGTYSFDKKNWEQAVSKVKEGIVPTIWADKKYVAANNRIFDAKTGKELTKHTKSNPHDKELRFITVKDGLFLRQVWGENESEEIIELLDDTGKIIWSKRTHLLAFNDHYVYVNTYDKDKNAWTLQQLDLYTGKVVKKIESRGNITNLVVGNDGYLTVVSDTLNSYNDKGKHLWTYKLPNVGKGKIVYSINNIYISDESGIITTIVIEPDSTTSPSAKQK